MEPVNAKDVRYFVLNGPPESGKSTVIARGLMHRFKILNENYASYNIDYKLRAVQDSFANPMKHFIATTLGIPYAELKKDTMSAILQGYTPREFLIHLSEHYIKDRYGEDAFGRWLEHRILRLDPLPHLVVIDDGGFLPERTALGAFARVIRVTRPSKSFSGDSRNFLSDPHYVIDNDGTLDQLEDKLDELANWCLSQLPAKHLPPEVQANG